MGQKGCQTECQNMFAACIYFQMVCRNHVRNWIVRRGGDLRKYFSLVTKISKIHAASISVYYRYLIHTTRKNRPIFNSISIQHGGPHTYITYAKCMYLPYKYIYLYTHTHIFSYLHTDLVIQIWQLSRKSPKDAAFSMFFKVWFYWTASSPAVASRGVACRCKWLRGTVASRWGVLALRMEDGSCYGFS